MILSSPWFERSTKLLSGLVILCSTLAVWSLTTLALQIALLLPFMLLFLMLHLSDILPFAFHHMLWSMAGVCVLSMLALFYERHLFTRRYQHRAQSVCQKLLQPKYISAHERLARLH